MPQTDVCADAPLEGYAFAYLDETTKRMSSKYEETALNINNIEDVIQDLMCELGIGGFMGIDDVKRGMKMTVTVHDDASSKDIEYHGELLEQVENTLFASLEKKLRQHVPYRLLSVMFFTAGAMPRFSLTAVKQLRKKLTVFRLPAVRRL